MSRRNKLQKFAEILAFPHVFENFDSANPSLTGEHGMPVDLKGKWSASYFKNDHPITLELACGKGEYTLGLAQLYPRRNLVGVDVKGARIWRGAKTALELNLPNVAFLRTRIEQIALFFGPAEVSEIWITFPDPFLRESQQNRRLTSPFFLKEYKKILRPGGLLHLKTDDPTLCQFTLDTLGRQSDFSLLYHHDDIYAQPLPLAELEIKTFYERQHLAAGKTTRYVQFRFDG